MKTSKDYLPYQPMDKMFFIEDIYDDDCDTCFCLTNGGRKYFMHTTEIETLYFMCREAMIVHNNRVDQAELPENQKENLRVRFDNPAVIDHAALPENVKYRFSAPSKGTI